MSPRPRIRALPIFLLLTAPVAPAHAADRVLQVAFADSGTCVGDCDGDGKVTIAELVRGVVMALDAGRTATCSSLDRDGNGAVEVSELVQAINAALSGCRVSPTPGIGRLSGRVTEAAPRQLPVANARVTLVSEDDSLVVEARSDATGRYRIGPVAPGRYRAGASALHRAFEEKLVDLGPTFRTIDFTLGAETHAGRWQIVGDPGDVFGGTDSGALLPDGRIIWCHDTKDPVVFDPLAGGSARFFFPPESPRIQGCHAVTLLPDGRVLYVGGADQPVYGPGTRQVKLYDPARNAWEVMPHERELVDARWYPSMAPLPNGGYIAVGGGGLRNPERIATSEVLDPETMRWRRVGDVAIGNEVSPIVLLLTGAVLMTHRPPQLYDPERERWRPAADFVQGNRMPNGDHADHEIVMLADGRVVAIGYKSFSDDPGTMVEIYDPIADRWTLGTNIQPLRSRASIVLLPDQRVLVMGGTKEDPRDPTPTNPWGQVALTDLYDPATDSWRRLNDLNVAREYHALPMLIPDGRVVIVGGEEEPGREPARSIVEVFEPPYLFRGPRPQIVDLGATSFRPGERIRFRIARTAAPTAVVLIGAGATTHFMDSGPGRYVNLEFEQSGDEISAQVPPDRSQAIPGFYLLFVLVDDVPSPGVVVRVAQ